MKKIKVIEMPKEEIRMDKLEESLIGAGNGNGPGATECGSCGGIFAYSISNKNTAEEKLPRQFLYRVESNTIIAYEKTYTSISALHFMYITRNG